MQNLKSVLWLALASCAGAKESPPISDAGSVLVNLVLTVDPFSSAEVSEADGFLYAPYGEDVEISVYDPDHNLPDIEEVSWQVVPDFSFELTQYGRASRVVHLKAVDDPFSFGGIEPSAELTVTVKDQNGSEGKLTTRVVSVMNMNGYWQGGILGVKRDWYLNVYQTGKTIQIGDFGRGRRYDGVLNGVLVEFTVKGDTYFEQFIGSFTTPNGLYGFHNIETDSCLRVWSLTR